MTSTKFLAGAIVLGIFGTLAFFGLSPFLNQTQQQTTPSVGSVVGSTFTNGKIAAVVMAPLAASATSTSIQNNSGSPIFVASFGFAGCTGTGSSYTYPNTNATGLANLLIQAATTSVANQGLQGNTNYALNMVVPTSTSPMQTSSSTPPAMAGFWDTGTYMTFTWNATSTLNCVIELDAINS